MMISKQKLTYKCESFTNTKLDVADVIIALINRELKHEESKPPDKI